MVEAAKIVLSESDRPMNVREIYDIIIYKGLYVFGAKDPISVLSGALRKSARDAKDIQVVDGCFALDK